MRIKLPFFMLMSILLIILSGCTKLVVTKNNLSDEIPTIDHWKIELYHNPADTIYDSLTPESITPSKLWNQKIIDTILQNQFMNQVTSELHDDYGYIDYDNIINTGLIRVELTTVNQLTFHLPYEQKYVEFYNKAPGVTGVKTPSHTSSHNRGNNPEEQMKLKNKIVKATLYLYDRAGTPLGDIIITGNKGVSQGQKIEITFPEKATAIKPEMVADVIADILYKSSR